LEARGKLDINRNEGVFSLVAKADRVDAADDGQALIYDYKSGGVPSKADMEAFAKQLLLEATIVQQGGFPDIGQREVMAMHYMSLKHDGKIASVETSLVEETWSEFLQLLSHYENPQQPYIARIRSRLTKFGNDSDHLSRKGEWEDGDDPLVEVVP
jgi:ATP-dependent helicase/nuclease subunit B